MRGQFERISSITEMEIRLKRNIPLRLSLRNVEEYELMRDKRYGARIVQYEQSRTRTGADMDVGRVFVMEITQPRSEMYDGDKCLSMLWISSLEISLSR